MVREYRRKPGARRYADYTPEQLLQCLESIRSGTLSHRKAADEFKIPRRTILNKLRGRHVKTPGHQPVFLPEQEAIFATYVNVMSDYGFPLTAIDLQHVIKSFLDRTGRNVKIFKENLPGKDWTKAFLQRHPQLTERFAANIKRCRAAIDEPMLHDYIHNLKKVTKDVPIENIWNLDETNLTDDPGQKKVICHRGVKYPEKICNFSKSSTSIMVCGSAAGEVLPPYVVYKSSQLWTTWTEGGPEGCRYQHTKSGWFDSVTYNDWFQTTLLPRLKKLQEKKVVIADNLSTHLNVQIFEKCREENIHFVCLPANSTHLTQPLDVAFFHPMKVAWRKVLMQWKNTPEGIQSGVLPKQQFPGLLKHVFEVLEPNFKQNLQSGFKKCGIVPCDVEPLLERISKNKVHQEAVSAAFLDILETTRTAYTNGTNNISRKRRKINVPAGMSVSHAEVVRKTDNELPVAKGSSEQTIKIREQSHLGESSGTCKAKKQCKRKVKPSSYEEFIDHYQCLDSSEDEGWEAFRQKYLLQLQHEDDCDKEQSPEQNFKPINRQAGAFVVFRYEGHLYPGVIEGCTDDGAIVSAMQKALKSWKWPAKKDELFYKWKDIIGGINPPQKINKRGFFNVPELYFNCVS